MQYATHPKMERNQIEILLRNFEDTLKNIPQPSSIHRFFCIHPGWLFGISSINSTPRKINMEPENASLEKENHLPNHLPGCSSLGTSQPLSVALVPFCTASVAAAVAAVAACVASCAASAATEAAAPAAPAALGALGQVRKQPG